MNPSRWRQVNDLFHAVLEQDPSEREQTLAAAAATDPDLVREVRSLLDTHDRTGQFLETPAWGVAPELILGDEASLAGRQLGPYRVVEEIGRGGMGVVYAAEDQRLGRMVALKALTPEYTRDPTRRERLTREARAAAALSHANIATVYALEELDGELFIASELVRGRTLREELRDGPLPPDRLRQTLLDIASALDAAHAQGIVHRDLKPDNVIRRDDGQIKILDFGLARLESTGDVPSVTRLTEEGVALGTPGYMAPEQLRGARGDARSDIFAFGVVAWELATGEHPFGADPGSALARMTELMEGRAGALSRPLPLAGLDRVARRCMRGLPDDRYQTRGGAPRRSPRADAAARIRQPTDRRGLGEPASRVVVVVPPGDRGGARRVCANPRVDRPALDRSAVRALDLLRRAGARHGGRDAAVEPVVHGARAPVDARRTPCAPLPLDCRRGGACSPPSSSRPRSRSAAPPTSRPPRSSASRSSPSPRSPSSSRLPALPRDSAILEVQGDLAHGSRSRFPVLGSRFSVWFQFGTLCNRRGGTALALRHRWAAAATPLYRERTGPSAPVTSPNTLPGRFEVR